MYVKAKVPEQKLTQVNTIQYYVKLYQVKITIVNFTDIPQKGSKISTSHIRYVDRADIYVTQIQKY